MPLVVVLALAASTVDPGEPPPLASGMDLLYGDRVPFGPTGEPLIPLGLASGRDRVVVRSRAPIEADYYEAGVLKRTTVRPGDAIELTVRRAQPAARKHYVDLEGVAWGEPDRLDWALAGWKARGYPTVQAIEEGTGLGIGGAGLGHRGDRLGAAGGGAAPG